MAALLRYQALSIQLFQLVNTLRCVFGFWYSWKSHYLHPSTIVAELESKSLNSAGNLCSPEALSLNTLHSLQKIWKHPFIQLKYYQEVMTGLYLFILSIFSIMLTSVVGAQFSAMKWCSYFYYYSKATRDCTLCIDRCSPGTGLVRNCGYDDYGNRVASACETCPSGYYSRIKEFNLIYRPSYPCARCRPCFPASRIKRSCSSTRNTKCTRCPHGKYKHSDGHCYKCSYCCDGMLEKNINVVKSCKKRGMGRCSCRAYTNCYNGRDNNAQCHAYRLEALKLAMKKKI